MKNINLLLKKLRVLKLNLEQKKNENIKNKSNNYEAILMIKLKFR